MDAQSLIKDGTTFAQKAIENDRKENFKLAHFFYMESAEALLKAIALDRSLEQIKVKALQYIERAETLQSLLGKIMIPSVIYLLCYFCIKGSDLMKSWPKSSDNYHPCCS